MNDKTLVEDDWQKAVAKVNLLQRELDITNADHIALWIEANTIPDEPMSQCISWLACRIIEAHEIEMAKARLALQSRIEALEAALRETMSRCTDCGGRGSFVKHDEVTDRDLWESCASCAVGYAALEGTKL